MEVNAIHVGQNMMGALWGENNTLGGGVLMTSKPRHLGRGFGLQLVVGKGEASKFFSWMGAGPPPCSLPSSLLAHARRAG